MICPQCHAEYREGFIRCSDCGIELEQLPEVPESAKEKEENKDFSFPTSIILFGGLWDFISRNSLDLRFHSPLARIGIAIAVGVVGGGLMRLFIEGFRYLKKNR